MFKYFSVHTHKNIIFFHVLFLSHHQLTLLLFSKFHSAKKHSSSAFQETKFDAFPNNNDDNDKDNEMGRI